MNSWVTTEVRKGSCVRKEDQVKSVNEEVKDALVIGVYAVYIIIIGGDFMNGFRFFVPILPLIYLCLQETLKYLFTYLRPSGKAKAMGAAVLTLLVLATFHPSALSFCQYPRAILELFRKTILIDEPGVGWTQDFIRMARHLQKVSSPGESIALIPVGAIPYYTELKTIDMLGLNDPYIAHQKPNREYTFQWQAGHMKGDGLYVLSKRPTYIQLIDYLTPEPTPGITEHSRHYPAIREIWSSPLFHQLYRPVSVQLNPGLYYNYYKLRKRLN